MPRIFDAAVVGRGLVGSAAARHLSEAGVQVALIGPGEPQDRRQHDGVFGSHYDSGRIVRILDPDDYYADTALASIRSYRPLERQTGIRFYREAGYLAVSNNESYLTAMAAQAQRLYPQIETLSASTLLQRFPYFHFGTDMLGLYQPRDGGWINPRHHLAAQNKALESNKGMIFDSEVTAVDAEAEWISLSTADCVIQAAKVLFATGAFANSGNLLPRKVDYTVAAHTVVLGEIKTDLLPALDKMPALSYRCGEDARQFIYFLPPIQYPDGRYYVKIGHSRGDAMGECDHASLIRWFQSDGDPNRIEWLTTQLHALLPSVQFSRLLSKPCVTTGSQSGRPYVDRFPDPRLNALLADNGQCAKSADELGRMGAHLVVHGTLPPPYQDADFALRYSMDDDVV